MLFNTPFLKYLPQPRTLCARSHTSCGQSDAIAALLESQAILHAAYLSVSNTRTQMKCVNELMMSHEKSALHLASGQPLSSPKHL